MPQRDIGVATLGAIIDNLRELIPQMGEVFFVDCFAGVDALGIGTFTDPLKTIQYAHDNYVSANRNDCIMCWSSDGVANFNENLAAGGLTISKNGCNVIGVDFVRIDNTNAGATAVITISGSYCWVLGFAIAPVGIAIGIVASGVGNKVGHELFPNVIDGCSPCDARVTGRGNKFVYNNHIDSLIGYDVRSAYNEIYCNKMNSLGGVGTYGIQTTAAGDNNLFRENLMINFANGINLIGGATGNMVVENSSFCTANYADANAVTLNAWVNNKERSWISHTNSIQGDLKDIYDKIGPGPGPVPTEIGDIYFVDCDGGSDATGDGTISHPWKTLDFAVGRCTADHNDMIAGWASAGGSFNESANVAGVLCDVQGVRIIGVDKPSARNTNGGATSVFSVRAHDIRIEGFAFDITGGFPQIVTTNAGWRKTQIVGNRFTLGTNAIVFDTITDGVISGNMIETTTNHAIVLNGCTSCEIFDNNILRPAINGLDIGLTVMCNLLSIHDNRIIGDNTGIGIDVNVGGGQNFSVTHNWIAYFGRSYFDTPGGSNSWVDNHFDEILLDHTITVAHGVAETLMTAQQVAARSGSLTVIIGGGGLTAGTRHRFKLYTIVNAVPVVVDQKDFDPLVDTTQVVLNCQITGGTNIPWYVTVQVNIVVGAPLLFRWKFLQEG